MPSRIARFLVRVVVCLSTLVASAETAVASPLTLEPLGTYATGVFAEGAAEIAAYDADTHRLFVVNGFANTVDVIDIADPTAPQLAFAIDISPYGAQANSVDVFDGLVAAAVQAEPKTDPGSAVFFDANGNLLAQVPVGALPDMVTFSPDGRWVLVANEAEPNDDYTVDPPGSVSVIDLRDGVENLDPGDVKTAGFERFDNRPVPHGVRIYGPGASVSQDLEPEYIAVSHDSRTAWVTLQENNAFAIVDIRRAKVKKLVALGTKDHSRWGRGLDPSDQDAGIAIGRWPVRGMVQPDAVAAFRWGPWDFLVTANEGDARDYDAFGEEERVKDLPLDPLAFPDPSIQDDDQLGRLNVTTVDGDTDGDGDYDRLHAFGSRSISIWSPHGRLLWDSGDQLERLTAAMHPDDFNSDNEENDSFDSRSDNKGPEPEAVTVGKIGWRQYIFAGLERIGGVAVYEVVLPNWIRLVTYVNNRDFDGDPEAGTAGDLGPEGVLFIPAADSPTGDPLLVTANEISGTTTVYRIDTD